MRVFPMLTMLFSLAPAVAAAQGFGGTLYNPAARQVQGPIGRGVTSPYLNLLRSGDPVLNYYGLVRPQVEFRASEERLQNGLNRLDGRFDTQIARQQNRQPGAPQVGTSGHSSRFMTNFHGRPESLALEMRGRRMEQSEQLDQYGRYRPQTGHTVLFGNPGYFYQQR